MSFIKRLFRKKQPQPPPLPEEINFDLLTTPPASASPEQPSTAVKNTLIKEDNRNEIFYNDNVKISYKYSNFPFDNLQIYSIRITTKDAQYIYESSNLSNRLFYTDNVPDKIPIYLNIKKLDKPIIKINEKQISQEDIKVDKLIQGDSSTTGRVAAGLQGPHGYSGGKKSRKRRSQKKKHKLQKSKKLRNQNKSKKRRSQKKKQRKTHRKRK